MPSRLNFRIRDSKDQYSTVSISLTPVTAINYDTVLGNLATQGRFELENAILGVINGNIARTGAVAYDVAVNDTDVADNNSRRESGLRIYGRGQTSQKLYTITIPSPDFDVLTRASTGDEIELADAGPMAALVTALEDNWKGYLDEVNNTTEAIVVEKAVDVGRNN